MTSVAVLHNPNSGLRDKRATIEECFRKAGLDTQFVDLKSGFEEEIAELYDTGFRTFIAAGGDGTVNALASQVVNYQGIKFGVVPMGTLNHFAKDLKLPLELRDAVKLIASNHSQKIDVGYVNDQLFLNNSSIGIYARIAHRKQSSKVWLIRFLLGIISGLWLIIKPPVYKLHIKIKADKKTYKTPIVFVGNNHYNLTGVGLANREYLNKGLLRTFIVRTRNPFRIILLMIGLLFGKINNIYFENISVPSLSIDSKRKHLLCAFDGEVKKMKTPITYRIRPKSLDVLQP